MRINRAIPRLPLVELARLRERAEFTDCKGIIAFIDLLEDGLVNRKAVKRRLDSLSIMERAQMIPIAVAPIRDPVLNAVFKYMDDVIRQRFWNAERQILFESTTTGTYDYGAATFRHYLYVAEVVPMFRDFIREPIDRFFGEMARQRATA